jgi:mRNA-degrading endonuclease YafQ of YafQ-DinJ toxin-antitoxin module
VKRALLRSTSFVRAAKRWIKKRPELAEALRSTLENLSMDTFQPQLKTHKLKGDLAGNWACSVEYDVRIVFRFVEQEGS